jgi:hypothetical protein
MLNRILIEYSTIAPVLRLRSTATFIRGGTIGTESRNISGPATGPASTPASAASSTTASNLFPIVIAIPVYPRRWPISVSISNPITI